MIESVFRMFRDSFSLYGFLIATLLTFSSCYSTNISIDVIGETIESVVEANDQITRVALRKDAFRGDKMWQCTITFNKDGEYIPFGGSEYQAEVKGVGSSPTEAMNAAIEAWRENR